MSSPAPILDDGWTLVVKKDCPTCVTIEPVIGELLDSGVSLAVYTQDDVEFPRIPGVRDDTSLTVSWHHKVETVPTLIKVEAGSETDRIVGWERSQWEVFTGETNLGSELVGYMPGCGSLSVDPDLVDELAVHFGASSGETSQGVPPLRRAS